MKFGRNLLLTFMLVNGLLAGAQTISTPPPASNGTVTGTDPMPPVPPPSPKAIITIVLNWFGALL